MDKPGVMVIVGPTASGKTDYAIALAKKVGGEVISADSRQIYARMNVGTAKPREAFAEAVHDVLQADVVEGVPHYLLNVASPDAPWTLADWQAAARRVVEYVEYIVERGKQPILAGGTMLYVDSMVKNFDIPAVEPDQALREKLGQEDVAVLYERLVKADPDAAAFIEPHHKQRIIRALEVMAKTGQPFSASRQQRPSRYEFKIIGLFPGWYVLHQRIQERVEKMFAEGLLPETEQLRRQFRPALPLLQTMNYKEAGMLLDGMVSREQAVAEAVKSNMRYGKRQMAWWRNRKEIVWKDY